MRCTICLLYTSISDLPREEYIQAEERVVEELKELQKPFVLVLNSVEPRSPETQKLRRQLEERYQVSCLALDLSLIHI